MTRRPTFLFPTEEGCDFIKHDLEEFDEIAHMGGAGSYASISEYVDLLAGPNAPGEDSKSAAVAK